MYILIAILVVYSVLLTYNVFTLKTHVDLLDKEIKTYKDMFNAQFTISISSIMDNISKVYSNISKTYVRIDELDKTLSVYKQLLDDLDEGLGTTKDQLQEVQSRLDILAKLKLYGESEGDTDGDDVVTENPIKDMDEIWNGMAFIDDEGNIRYPTAGGQEKIAKWVTEHPTDIDFEKDVDEH